MCVYSREKFNKKNKITFFGKCKICKEKKFNVFIKLNKNNVFCVLRDSNFKIKHFLSSGMLGFKKKAKKTLFASRNTILDFFRISKRDYSVSEVAVFIHGFKRYRRPIIRSLSIVSKFRIRISSVHDITSIPHNGCRLKKPRRI
jgi:small subunit ribosomal protein S11